MRRRGFTIIETVLAASLGAAVVLVCLGIMGAMDRTQEVIARRQTQVEMLSRLHLVMERTFSSLVMAELNTGAVNLGGRTPLETGLQRDGIRGGERMAEPRPRLLLGPDPNASRQGPVQRLEVVVSKAPVPPGWGRSTTAEVMEAQEAFDALQVGMAATRGVFELRPDEATPVHLRDNLAPPEPGGWTLWWRPLPAQSTGEDGDPYMLEPWEDPTAVPVVSGLVQCRWLAFKAVSEPGRPRVREKQPALESMDFQGLPAYMEMEVRTAGGLTANWMFEIGWLNGPETLDELESQEGGEVILGGARFERLR